MAWCRDDLQTELTRCGYSLVRLPRSDIAPLGMVGVDGSSRTVLGNVSDIWPHDDEEIATSSGPAANIEVTRTSKMNASLGARFLAPVFSLFKADVPTLKGAYNGAARIQFEFQDPEFVRRSSLQLGAVLGRGTLPENNAVLDRYLFAPGGRLWIITEVLRSKQIVVSTFDEHGASLDVDDVQVQAGMSASAGLAASRIRQGEIRYSGPEPLTFGFKGLDVVIEDGELTVDGVSPGEHLAAGDAAGEPDGRPLDTNGPTLLDFDTILA